MQRRKLGRTSLEVPIISFGAYAIGGWYWGGTDDEEAKAAIRAAVGAGMNAFDTAPIYGFGHSERLIGEVLRGLPRSDVVVMTKVGLRWDHPTAPVFFEAKDTEGHTVGVQRTSAPDSVREEVERSLERLGTDYLDLVQVHARDPETPIVETMGALAELFHAGRVRAIGVSNFDVPDLEQTRRALGDIPLASDQPPYSLLSRGVEADILPWAREHQVGLLTYAPLDQGLLTGKVDAARTFPESDGRHRRPSFTPVNRRRVNALLEEIVEPIAAAHGATVAQTVLAWTAAQPGVTTVLVGARRPAQARENAGAGDLELSADELASIDRAFSGHVLAVRPRERLRRLAGRVARRLGFKS